MTSNDPYAAILDQLAAHHEQLTQHTRLLQRHAAALTDLAGTTPGRSNSGGGEGYQPGPAPRWCALGAGQRAEPVGRLRAWVEQVYRPGYGHLAATLAPCWEAHDLCLYGLDIAATLWSLLYLQPDRTPGLVSAQAEYQVRILPALAGQLQTETSRCGHPRGPLPAQPGGVR